MPASIEDYQKRLNDIFGDMFTCGLKEWDGENGDLISIADWLRMVETAGFIDYDGHGNFAFYRVDGKVVRSNITVKPSDITFWKVMPPPWASHVLWFNR